MIGFGTDFKFRIPGITFEIARFWEDKTFEIARLWDDRTFEIARFWDDKTFEIARFWVLFNDIKYEMPNSMAQVGLVK